MAAEGLSMRGTYRLIGLSHANGMRKVTVGRRLSDREEIEFLESCRHLRDFRRSRELFPLVRLNCNQAIVAADQIRAMPLEKLHGLYDREHLTREANRLLVNFFASFKLYLDHMKTRLARRYGDPSVELTAFVNSTRHAFDSTPEYRIVSKARDYVQHCGMIIESVQLATYLEQAEGNKIGHSVSVLCSRTELLDRFSSWGRAKQDLLALPEAFDLFAMLPPVVEALGSVDMSVMNAETPSLREHAQRIVTLTTAAAAGFDQGCIASYEYERPHGTMGIVLAPVEVIQWLGLPIDKFGALTKRPPQ